MAKRRETKQNKQQAVPKRKKEKCCDKTKRGGKTLIHVVGIFFFFSKNLDTTVTLTRMFKDQFVPMKWATL